MWEASYGKEPFDLRLTVLRVIRNFGLILAAAIGGTLLFGGGYYVKNVLLRPDPSYRAASTYRVEYRVAEETDVSTVHINEMTWNTYVDTQLFLDEMEQYLKNSYSGEELAEAVNVVMASNLRVISTVVVTGSPEKSLEIAGAAESALTRDFPSQLSEVISISVMDPAVGTEEIYPDVRPLRAVLLSALLSFFFALVFVLLRELGSDSIWLPSTLWRRYGLRPAGTMHSPELWENLGFFFRGKKEIAVCPVQEGTDPAQVADELRRMCPKEELWQDAEWVPVPAPLLCPESCRALRQADGILLAVAAGSHAGKQLERTLEFLEQQDCKITCVLLWEADETLLRVYYGFRKQPAFQKGTED